MMDIDILLKFKNAEKPSDQDWEMFDKQFQTLKGKKIIEPLHKRMEHFLLTHLTTYFFQHLTKPIFAFLLIFSLFIYLPKNTLNRNRTSTVEYQTQTFVYDTLNSNTLDYVTHDLSIKNYSSLASINNDLSYHQPITTWVTAFNF